MQMSQVQKEIAPDAGNSQADAELFRLWQEYQANVRDYEAADAACAPVRAAFDAEMPPCPEDVLPGDHWREQQPLWNKYGLDALCDVCNAADEKARATIAAILAAKAGGLLGIGIKLAAVPVDSVEPEDLEEGIASALADIRTLTGVDLTRVNPAS